MPGTDLGYGADLGDGGTDQGDHVTDLGDGDTDLGYRGTDLGDGGARCLRRGPQACARSRCAMLCATLSSYAVVRRCIPTQSLLLSSYDVCLHPEIRYKQPLS
eukprot:1985421-Rhodomonas_salina.2